MAEDLSKRGKVGDVYRSGSYKKAKKSGFKTAGLSSDQMKKATTLKGKKVSAAQMKKAGVLQKIENTKFVKGKGVVGPGGKAFTGSVILASGKSASYVKGRRIGVSTAKPKARAGTRNQELTPPPPGVNKNNARLKKQGMKTSKLQDRAASKRGGMKPRTTTNVTTRRSSPRSKKTAADIWSEKFSGWYRGKID